MQSIFNRGGFLLLVLLLGGCGAPAPREGITLVAMKPDQLEVWEAAYDEFRREHPHIPLHVEISPRSSTQYHDLLAQKLKNRDPSIDVFFMDVTWPPEFAAAGWARPLDDLFPIERQHRFLQGPIEANTFAGRIYGVPSRVDAGMLYYRRDLLERYGFEAPRTWPELVAQAEVILAGERATNPMLVGYSAQFKQYEGLVCNMLELIGSNGGSLVRTENGRLQAAILDPPALEAVAFLRTRILGALAPRGTLAYEETESLALFTQGQAIFHRNWPYAWEVANNPGQSLVAGRAGVTALPAFPGHQSVSTLGGYQYAISAHSQRVAEAWAFIEFMTSDRMQKYFAIHGGLAPALAHLYEDEEVLAANPQFIDQRPAFFNARPRPSTPLYPMVSNVLQRYFSRALADDRTDIEALAGTAARDVNAVLDLVPEDLEERLADLGGQPPVADPVETRSVRSHPHLTAGS